MSADEPVTRWIEQFKAGDRAAVQGMWENYFRRLVGLARRKLRDTPRRVADEEDVALSAFHSFCRGVERGRFPQLSDRHDLWSLLALITARKAADVVQRQQRQKRGGGRVQGESALSAAPAADGTTPDLAQVLGREPTPEDAAQMAEECRRLLDSLGDGALRSIAQWKLEGYTSEEIADRLGCVPRTVERKLHRIRTVLECQGRVP